MLKFKFLISGNNDEADEKTPFKWKSVIIEVLNETPEHKMTIKKLRKKVILKIFNGQLHPKVIS